MVDFLRRKKSENLHENSFKMELEPAKLSEIFPKFISESLLSAFNHWKTDYPLFISDHAILIGGRNQDFLSDKNHT